MNPYQHILLAADFSDHGLAVAQRAKALADFNQAQLSLVHIVDYLPISDTIYGPVIPFDANIIEELMNSARQQLQTLGETLGVDKDHWWLEQGSPKHQIVQVAEEHEVDLIVVGSHGRHGFALLLGSTATGVLHHAKCDVLAVRLQDD